MSCVHLRPYVFFLRPIPATDDRTRVCSYRFLASVVLALKIVVCIKIYDFCSHTEVEENMPVLAQSCTGTDKATIIVSIAVIIISVTCAVLVGIKSGQRKTIQQNLEPQTTMQSFDWCLSCQSLAKKGNPGILEKLDKTPMRGDLHCCANNSEQKTIMLELMIATGVPTKPEVQRTFDAGNFALGKASAHKQLTMSTFRSAWGEPVFLDNENMALEFDLNTEDPLIEHVRNIEVTKFAMIVQYPGLYYVYSSVFFKPDSARPCKSLAKQTWEHNIVLTRHEDKEHSGVIFNTTYTCCDDCVHHKKTSYAGGLFHLQRYDRLHVEVSSDGVVSPRKEGSYFGLFMLD